MHFKADGRTTLDDCFFLASGSVSDGVDFRLIAAERIDFWDRVGFGASFGLSAVDFWDFPAISCSFCG